MVTSKRVHCIADAIILDEIVTAKARTDCASRVSRG
jgi:hypothetical protein